MSKEPTKIVILVEGGLIQDVLSEENIEYVVVDYDTESVNSDELFEINGSDATVSINKSEANADAVNIIYSQFREE